LPTRQAAFQMQGTCQSSSTVCSLFGLRCLAVVTCCNHSSSDESSVKYSKYTLLDGWVNLNPHVEHKVNCFHDQREVIKGNWCAFVQLDAPMCAFVQSHAPSCNLVQSRAIPCNQSPQKEKGAGSTLFGIFRIYLKGNT
jgi:hypothetical protein